jgi:hypothetical protein
MSRRIVITQSNYLPWRGYFDMIDDADVFVVYDDVQYTKNDWRNRNRIKTKTGAQWLTVPVRHIRLGQSVDSVETSGALPWRGAHRQAVQTNYGKAKFFHEAFAGFEAALECAPSMLTGLNRALIRWAMERLAIRTEIVDVRDLSVGGYRSERLIAIVRALGGDIYLSGPSAAAYLDVEAFRAAGIGLEYKSYAYEAYPQLWGDFEGNVSILDLILNQGRNARQFLKSSTPNIRIV